MPPLIRFPAPPHAVRHTPSGAVCEPSTSAGTRVSGYILWVLTSDPSEYLTRHLLSYLDHQETTVSRPDFLVPVRETSPFYMARAGCRKPSKSART
jgi:hypothetical protein